MGGQTGAGLMQDIVRPLSCLWKPLRLLLS